LLLREVAKGLANGQSIFALQSAGALLFAVRAGRNGVALVDKPDFSRCKGVQVKPSGRRSLWVAEATQEAPATSAEVNTPKKVKARPSRRERATDVTIGSDAKTGNPDG